MKMTGALVITVALSAAVAQADKRVDDAVARAESQFQKGRTDEAVKTMERAASQLPTSPEAQLALARMYWRAGSAEQAGAATAKAVELSASADAAVKADVLAGVSGLKLLGGPGTDALKYAEEAVKAQETPVTLAALARAQARVRHNAKALETAQKAAQLGPTVAAAQHALGTALLAARRPAEAEAALRKALELDPKLTSARVDLAEALTAQGKPKEAIEEAKKATEADPRSGEAFAALGTALLAADKNSWSEAIAQAQQGAFLTPGNPVVQVAVGRIFEAQGNLDQATSAYRRALEADPGYIPARSALLQIQVLRGELDAALPEAKKLAAEAPESAEPQLQLGRILLRKGDFSGAVEPLEKAAKADPQNAEAQALLGTAYQYTRQSDDALEAYKKAVQLAPANASYRATYGLLLGVNKQYDQGAAELQKVIATPGYKEPAAYVNLGWVYRNMEPSKPTESVSAYKKALELDPKNEQAALGMGWAYSYMKQYDEGIAAFKKAIELDPKVAGEAYDGIAWSYFFKKDMAAAKDNLAKAKAAGRNDTRLEANIDKFEKGQQEAEEAEKAFRAQQRAVDEPDVNTLGNQVMHGGPSARRSAARQLRQFGRPAVQFLIYAATSDKDLDVREEAINSLGAIGAGARDQCGQVRAIATGQNPYEKVVQERAEMELAAKYEDVRRAAKAAMGSIGCN